MNRSLLLLCAVAVLLAACSSGKKEPQRLCPQTAIVREIERVKDYGGETPDDNAVVASALMRGVQGRCDYRDDGVSVSFDIKMTAGRGDRLGGDHVSFPFFVAVLDSEQKILSKELMTADFAFSGKDKKVEKTESLDVFIPMDKDADGTNYQVLLGFQLTEDQLKAARKDEAEPEK
ncbi:MAG: hypothetical protein PHY92_08405 [Alphaproteobacteria bacterium]|nr:hypothetical protein [Alphaproteobacteria bacterium]